MFMVSRREGFAIPMAILLIGVITAGVVGAFARVESENSTVVDREVQTDAYALAEAGLSRYLATRMATPEDQDYDLPGGRAEVRVRLMRADDGINGSLYLIRSTGMPTVSPLVAPARHTVAQLGWHRRATMQVVAGWTSLSGLNKAGTAGEILGFDACAEQDAVAGVAVPSGTFTGQSGAVDGNPPIKLMGAQSKMKQEIKIDWASITAHEAMSYDLMVPPDAWPTPEQFAADTSWWPVIYIDNKGGSFDPKDVYGRGTLIVRGDLILDGGDVWDGIILVGGKIDDNGTGAVAGAVVSGLNVKLGETVQQSSKANGTKDYEYDSCKVAAAASRLSMFVAIRNSWIDTWAEY